MMQDPVREEVRNINESNYYDTEVEEEDSKSQETKTILAETLIHRRKTTK